MNIVMQILGMMKSGSDPSQFVINALRQQNTPFANNAADMIEKGDSAGIEKLARNMCNAKGIKPEDALKQAQSIRTLFGM